MHPKIRIGVMPILAAVLAVVLAALAAVLLPTSAQAASSYPPQQCATVSVSTTAPLIGQKISVTGSYFKAKIVVPLELTPYGALLAKPTTDGKGHFAVKVKLPADARGNQLITAHAKGRICPADPIQLSIGGSGGGQGGNHGSGHGGTGTSAGGGGLAGTGVDVALIAGAGAVLLAAGLVLTRGGRRRFGHS